MPRARAAARASRWTWASSRSPCCGWNDGTPLPARRPADHAPGVRRAVGRGAGAAGAEEVPRVLPGQGWLRGRLLLPARRDGVQLLSGRAAGRVRPWSTAATKGFRTRDDAAPQREKGSASMDLQLKGKLALVSGS